MRHETAHALDNAYALHRRGDWREVFGRFDSDYVSHYQPKPYSKRFVRHLELWYAQSHPAEDFAETFAVWLDPTSRWRSRYRGWPALREAQLPRRPDARYRGKKAGKAHARRASSRSASSSRRWATTTAKNARATGWRCVRRTTAI